MHKHRHSDTDTQTQTDTQTYTQTHRHSVSDTQTLSPKATQNVTWVKTKLAENRPRLLNPLQRFAKATQLPTSFTQS